MIGKWTKVHHPHLSNINPECEIGEGCSIHSHVWIGGRVKIGDAVSVQAFAYIPDGVTIEDQVFLGPRVTFTNDKRPPSYGAAWADTLVREWASIGAGAIILPGVTIGRNARIGAGSVVTKDVPDGETWVGNPARVVRERIVIGPDCDGP